MPASNTFVQIPSELLTDKTVSPLELRLYCVLMDLGFKGRGYSQAGHQYLGKLLDTHPQTIAKSLKKLSQLGFICVERVGLNRNDKIRCLKTVQKEKRSEPRSSVKYTGSHICHSTNRKKIIKTIEEPAISESVEKSKTIPPNPARVANVNIYEDRTKALQNGLEQATRQKSYDFWLKDLAIVGESEEMTISVGKTSCTEYDWVVNNYKSLIEQVAGKPVILTE